MKHKAADNHASLRQAASAMYPAVLQQRHQFNLSRNIGKNAPNMELLQQLGKKLRQEIWQSGNLEQAEQVWRNLVVYRLSNAPKLSKWLEEKIK